MLSSTTTTHGTASVVSPKLISPTPPNSPAGNRPGTLHRSRALSNLSELLHSISIDSPATPQDTFQPSSTQPQPSPADDMTDSEESGKPETGHAESSNSPHLSLLAKLRDQVFTLQNPGPSFIFHASQPQAGNPITKNLKRKKPHMEDTSVTREPKKKRTEPSSRDSAP